MNSLIRCIRQEYQEMPGLALTLPQAELMWDVDEHTCRAALETLIASGFLTRREDGRFVRRDAWHQGWCPWCHVAA